MKPLCTTLLDFYTNLIVGWWMPGRDGLEHYPLMKEEINLERIEDVLESRNSVRIMNKRNRKLTLT